MAKRVSARLLGIINALPLREGMRVPEIGCGPGAMAREIARRVGHGTCSCLVGCRRDTLAHRALVK